MPVRSTSHAQILSDGQASDNNFIDSAGFYARQQYLDFLNREPDAAGIQFWSNQITACGSDAACVETKRTNVSQAFFLSIEFQQTGFLVFRFYRMSYADNTQRPRALPRLDEFLRDTYEVQRGVVVNAAGWEQQLEENKKAFAEAWVQRPDFLARYPGTMSADAYVDALFAHLGVSPLAAERTRSSAAAGSKGARAHCATPPTAGRSTTTFSIPRSCSCSISVT